MKIDVSNVEYGEVLEMFKVLNRDQQIEFLPRLFNKLEQDGLNLKSINFIIGDFLPYMKEK